MNSVLTYIIVILGLINITRMALFTILGDWYDLTIQKKIREKYSRKGNYEPLVSVVIAALNEERTIVRTIRSVAASTYKQLQIVVVNDGSTDRTADKVLSYKQKNPLKDVVLLSQNNGGKARALNLGIRKAATGSLIMTLDADSLVAKDAVAKAVHYFRNPRVKAVASNVRILKTPTILGLIQYIEYLIGYRLKKSYTVLTMEYIIGGIGSMFRKSILRTVRWYDTDTVTEDIDLTMKIVREGNKKYQVLYGADVLTYTEPVQSLADLLKQRYRWKFGRFQTLFKNKALFFRVSPKHTKFLTFFQLPFVLFTEFTYLWDPLFIIYIYYMSYRYNEVATLQWAMLFYFFYVYITVVSDAHTTIQEKIALLFIAPLSYLFFFVISVVEYVALWKCIIGYRGIVKAREINECSWIHVERAEAYSR